MTTYSDAYLDYWSDVYVAYDVRRTCNLLLEQFLRDPRAVLGRLQRIECAGNAEPAVPVRQIRRDNRYRQRGQLLMQKLWHGSRRRNHADAPLPSRR